MILITTHSGTDFDALASLMAASRLYPEAKLFLPGSPEKQVREYLKKEGFPGKFSDFNELQEELDLLVIVDTRYRSRIGRVAELIGKNTAIHIYDHHPAASDENIAANVDVRKEYGATVTILLEMLAERGVKLSPEEATLAAMGIYEDTGCLTYPLTTPEDLEAVAGLLKNGADLRKVTKYVIHSLSERQIALLHKMLKNRSHIDIPAGRVVFLKGALDEYIEDLAAVVHKAMDILKPQAMFAFISIKERTICIARSSSREIDVGSILEELGGGGHPTAASASLEVSAKDAWEKITLRLLSGTPNGFELVSHPARVIPAGHSAEEAYRAMAHLDQECAPVGDPEGRLYGVVEREELKKAVRHGLKEHRVSEFISGRVPRAPEGLSGRELTLMLARSGCSFMVIEKNGAPSGMVELRPRGTVFEHPPVTLSIRDKVEKSLDRDAREILRDAAETASQMGITVYCAGGMVRDILMGRPHKDIDLVAERDGIRFAGLLAGRLGGSVSAHKKFRTAVIKLQGREIDVATLRKEYYEFPGALPDVDSGTLKQDLYRRDFTINSMAVQINPPEAFGKLIDYFEGHRDLLEGRIRILYPLSFIEDPTRIFRAARFEERFGFRLSDDTLDQLKKAVSGGVTLKVSPDRIKEELLLIFSEEKPHNILRRLENFGALGLIGSDIKLSDRVYDALRKYASGKDLPDKLKAVYQVCRARVMTMLLLYEMRAEKGAKFLRRYHFPKKTVNDYMTAKSVSGSLVKVLSRDISPARLYKALHSFTDSVLLCTASLSGVEVSDKITRYMSKYRDIKPLTTGEELRELGITPGPVYSNILLELRLLKLNGTFSAPDDEIKYVYENYIVDKARENQ